MGKKVLQGLGKYGSRNLSRKWNKWFLIAVAAKSGGKALCAGVPAVRTDIAGLPRKARKKPLTFTMGGDSVRFLQLTDNIS